MKNNSKPLVAVLGASAVKENGVWRTTNFGESDGFGGLGDRLRVVAGAELYKRFPDATVFASGGRGKLSHVPDMPTLASVVRRELIELGVPENAIQVEEKSGSTLEQLAAIESVVADYASIEIVSNRYHLPRICVMIAETPSLAGLRERLGIGDVRLASAEQVLMNVDATLWGPVIERGYADPAMKRRLENEWNGLIHLCEGTYGTK